MSSAILGDVAESFRNLESDRIARFRRRLRYSMAAAAVVFVSLAGGAYSYVFVNGAPSFLRELMTGIEELRGDESAPPAEEESAWRAPLEPAPPWPLASDEPQPDGRG